MNPSIYNLVYILSNIFMTYTIYKFIKIFYSEKNTNRKIEIGSYALYFIITTIFFLLIKLPIIFVILNLVLFFMLTFNYKSSLKKRILTSLLIYVILMCIEVIIGIATGYLDIGLLIKSDYESILGIIVIRITSYLVALIIGGYKNIRQGDTIPYTYWLSILIIPVGTLYLLLTIFMNSSLTAIRMFTSTALVLFINFATFYVYDEISRILSEKADEIFMQQEIKNYENQLELMKSSLKANEIIRHDIKNHVASLYVLAEGGKREELLEYLSEVMEVADNNERFSYTGNTIIDSIINFKLQGLEEEGVAINIDINIPKDLKVPSFDATVILGNLLDNAINAVRKLEEDKYINIMIKYTKGRLILKMENSFNGEIIKKDEIINTSHSDKENHGLGLESVKTVLEKYDGTIELKYDDKKFHTALLLFVG